MTIEGRPNLIPDPLFEANMMKSYDEQRKSRLGDAVSDYLNDEDKTAKEFYDDLIDELDDWMKYHQRYAEKYKAAKMMINGHRKITEPDYITDYQNYQAQFLTENYDGWDNFPNETGDYIASS